jgi:MSHA pilin protein MshC
MNLLELKPGTWNLEQRACIARARGFTMVEMVVVIAILGLLAAVIGPRFVGRDAFASRGFHDEAQSVVRYAQKTAIAWRNIPIFVCVTATAVAARSVSCAGTLLVHPATGAALTTTAPSGVTLSPTGNFSFNGAGRPSAAQTITLTSTIAGDPARSIVVEAETGYVHP